MSINKKICLFFCILFCTFSVFAEEKNFQISFSSEAGVFNGKIKEYVVDFDDNSESYILSRLDWQILNIPYLDLNIDINYLKHLKFELGCKIGISKNSGTMHDYDWMNPNDHTDNTHHSCHANMLDNFSQIKFNGGWSFYLPAQITLTPFISYEYENISFTGYNGWYQYPNEEGTFEGRVIGYEQSFNALRFGFLADTTIVPFMDFDLSFFVTPLFAINGVDTHFLTNACYWDKMQKGVLLEGKTDILYKANDKISFGLTGGIQFIPFMFGDTYSKTIKSKKWRYAYGIGGTDRILWNAGAVINIRF